MHIPAPRKELPPHLVEVTDFIDTLDTLLFFLAASQCRMVAGKKSSMFEKNR
jgi:hypothetical protein